jgi:anti-sigma B factor antagonist
MNIAQRLIGDITILDLQGNIMFEDGDLELRGAITSVLQAGGKKVILNMGEVPYLDSAGLSELVRSFVAVNKRGGRVAMIDLTRKVNDLLTIAKLLTVFETFDSEAEAIRSFEAPSPRSA